MITAYFIERFRPSLFLPLAVVLAVAASGGHYDAWPLVRDAALALLLLAQFRLWDDLADRPADALRHPDRVLVKTPSPDPFVRLCVTLAFINFGVAVGRDPTGISLAALGLLHGVLGGWYLGRSRRTVLGDQLLMAKYPGFVLILSGGRLLESPVATAVAAAVVYLAALAYEAWHDPSSPIRAIRSIHSGGGS